MQTFKLSLPLLGALILGSGLVGCGDDSSGGGSSSKAGSAGTGGSGLFGQGGSGASTQGGSGGSNAGTSGSGGSGQGATGGSGGSGQGGTAAGTGGTAAGTGGTSAGAGGAAAGAGGSDAGAGGSDAGAGGSDAGAGGSDAGAGGSDAGAGGAAAGSGGTNAGSGGTNAGSGGTSAGAGGSMGGSGGASAGVCCEIASTPGCSGIAADKQSAAEKAIEACVCAQDDYCCTTEWDQTCIDEIVDFKCGEACGGGSGGSGGMGSDECTKMGATSCFSNYDCMPSDHCEAVVPEVTICCLPGPRGTGKAGEMCSSEADCESALCIDSDTAGTVCTTQCKTEADCPEGLKQCIPIAFSGSPDKFCAPTAPQ